MRPTRLLAISAVLLVGLGAAVPQGANASRTIYANTKKVQRIGDWRIAHHPTLRAAIRAYGEPDRLRSRYGGNGCVVRWWRLGLKVVFADFGGGYACDSGLAQNVTIRGRSAKRHRWHTWKGVHIGSTVRALRHRHPDAQKHGRWWWIKSHLTYIGTTRISPILKARTHGGRVRAFSMSIGAAGD
jgi:hypothetical protein